MTDQPTEPNEPTDTRPMEPLDADAENDDQDQDIASRYPDAAAGDASWERPDPDPEDPDPALRPPQTG
jgi:hypothetical protein